MNRYFYHGIEFYWGVLDDILNVVLKILDEGLKNRNYVSNFKHGEKYNHVCLYRKNEEFDYDKENAILQSALSGWINNCFVFVVNPDIKARKAVVGVETDLVDEWRSIGDISINDIVGIALPYGAIKEYLEDEYQEEDIEQIKEKLKIIENKASEMGLFIVNSEVPNFTDELDSSLNKSHIM